MRFYSSPIGTAAASTRNPHSMYVCILNQHTTASTRSARSDLRLQRALAGKLAFAGDSEIQPLSALAH
jgi:hypothetical protein